MESPGRNPSPTPNESLASVAVGKTLFSRSFLYSTLLEWVNGLKERYGTPENSSTEVIELDPAFDDSLCQLWDMTLEPDVVDMLVEHDVISLISQTLGMSNAPRLNEIALGILANILSVSPRLRMETIASNVALSELVLESLYTSDSPTIYEALRVLNCLYYDVDTCLERLGHEGFLHVKCLTSSLLETKDVPNILAFILSSSTNDDVLTQCLSFLGKIIGIELEGAAPFARSFSLPEHLKSIVEGTNQLGVTKSENIANLQTWRAGVYAVGTLESVVTYKKHSSESREIIPSASEVCKALANFLYQCASLVDAVEDGDVVTMHNALNDIASILDSGIVSCHELKMIAIRGCALVDAIFKVMNNLRESETGKRSELSNIMTATRTLISKAFKNFPTTDTAMAAEELTKLMKYLEIPSAMNGNASPH